MARSRWGFREIVTLGLLAALVACGGEPTGFTGQVSVRRFFAGVYAVMPDGATGAIATGVKADLAGAVAAPSSPIIVNAVLRTGEYAKSSTAPAATVVLESSIITGMPAKMRVQGDAPFTRIALTVPGS